METTAQLIETIFSFSRCMKERMGGKLQGMQISVVQLQTLLLVKKQKTVSMKEIAAYLQIELPSATSLIDHFVKESLVTRKTNAKDKRLMDISLTEEGKTVLEKMKKERTKVMKQVLSPLVETEKKQLLTILVKMTKAMKTTNL